MEKTLNPYTRTPLRMTWRITWPLCSVKRSVNTCQVVEAHQMEAHQVEVPQVEARRVEEDGGMDIMQDLRVLQGSLKDRRNTRANLVRSPSSGFTNWIVTSMRIGLWMTTSKGISCSVSLPAKHAVSTTTPCSSTAVFP